MMSEYKSPASNGARRGNNRVGSHVLPAGKLKAQAFDSILFEHPRDRTRDDSPPAPDFFRDLNCDQIVAGVTAGYEEYNLSPFFHQCLRRVDSVRYRQEVMQDLDDPFLFESVDAFALTMRKMRERIAWFNKLHCTEQRQAWFLDAVANYCDTIDAFGDRLGKADLRSRGFLGFRDHLTAYAASPSFAALRAETRKLQTDLATLTYGVLINGDRVTVRRFEAERDYSAEVEATFKKFKQGAVTDYLVKFSETAELNHIEVKILEFVARLHPEVFVPLDAFCIRNASFLDPTIGLFDREVQFYVAYLKYIEPLRKAGLRFCYPNVTDQTKDIHDDEGFDIALARKLLLQDKSVVCNDFHLEGRERIIVASGPNQGGKTTFARAFGQIHYLASIGCPVPGSSAQLYLFDRLFTHFEREEKVANLRGKLEDDLKRIHQILGAATARSIIVMNEIFTSTTLTDETCLSANIMRKISDMDVTCVWVTFVDELASFGPQTVSMVSTVVPKNPALRTFKIVRRPADGLAYAMAIAQKHGLTFERIKERVKS